jgi:hypothetical protein
MTMQFGCLCSEDALVCCNVEEERISRMLVESGQGGWRREKIGGGGRYDTMTSDQQLSSTWSSWLQLQFGLLGKSWSCGTVSFMWLVRLGLFEACLSKTF